MKKTLLTTLIAAGISTAPLANELAKLSFATDNSAQTPTQKIAVQEKTAQTSASSKTEGADTIPERIFDQTDNRQLAVLTPDEMAETEGATIEHGPGGFGFGPIAASEGATMFSRSVVGSVAKGAAKEFTKGVALTQVVHYGFHGEPADLTTAVVGGVIQTIGGARAAYPAFVGTTMPKTGYSVIADARNTAITTAATLPWYSSNLTYKSSTPAPLPDSFAVEQHTFDSPVTNVYQDFSLNQNYVVEVPKKPIAVSGNDFFSTAPSWRDNFIEARKIESNITPSFDHKINWGGSSGDR